MAVKQISVFLENKAGRLSEITEILGSANIDISALSLADTTHFGILRLIVNNPSEAEAILKEQGCTVSLTEVLAIGVDDTPGSLSKALKLLTDKGMGVDYIYAFVGSDFGKAMVIIKTEDMAGASAILAENGVRILSEEEVYGR